MGDATNQLGVRAGANAAQLAGTYAGTAAVGAGVSAIGAGAALGSVVPVIGTAIGAIVGAVAGSLLAGDGPSHGRGTKSRARHEKQFADRMSKQSLADNQAGLAKYLDKWTSDKALVAGNYCDRARDPFSCKDQANLWSRIIQSQQPATAGDVGAAPADAARDPSEVPALSFAAGSSSLGMSFSSPSTLPSTWDQDRPQAQKNGWSTLGDIFSTVGGVAGNVLVARTQAKQQKDLQKALAKGMIPLEYIQAGAGTYQPTRDPQSSVDMSGFLQAMFNGGGRFAGEPALSTGGTSVTFASPQSSDNSALLYIALGVAAIVALKMAKVF